MTSYETFRSDAPSLTRLVYDRKTMRVSVESKQFMELEKLRDELIHREYSPGTPLLVNSDIRQIHV